MYDSQVSGQQLVMRWIPVVDPSGRTRMESCWISTAPMAPAQSRPAYGAGTHAA